MPYFQHYSFDLWLTLIRSDPRFKAERARIFHRDFNILSKSLEEVAQAFRTVDLFCTAINERTGKNIDAEEMYLMVISILNDNKLDLQQVDLDKLQHDMEALVFEYLPQVYAPETIEVLDHLKQREHTSISILSNTGFIKGDTLRKVLSRLDMARFFDLQIYSDEAGLSKPHPALFALMMDGVRTIDRGRGLSHADIIHVGDNPIADVKGAHAAGMKSMLINSNDISILKLIDQ